LKTTSRFLVQAHVSSFKSLPEDRNCEFDSAPPMTTRLPAWGISKTLDALCDFLSRRIHVSRLHRLENRATGIGSVRPVVSILFAVVVRMWDKAVHAKAVPCFLARYRSGARILPLGTYLRGWHRLILAAGLVLSAMQAQAQNTETFRTNTLSNSWTLTGSACLTVSGGTTPCSALVPSYNDATGQGWLRLTSASINQAGNAILATNFALNSGFDIRFTYAMYSGGTTPGDGISFFFIDPSVVGAGTGGVTGGGLGYCQMKGGVLGFGFDQFGNFSNQVGGTCGSTGPGQQRSNISVRGGALASTPWLFLTGTGVISNTALRTDSGWAYPVIQPCASGSCVRTGKQIRLQFYPDVTCGANQYRVTVNSITAGTVLANLCVSTANLGAIPSTLHIGFAGSTGSVFQNQEIRDLTITQTADLATTKTDGTTSVNTGSTTTYTLLVTNNGPSGGDGAVLTDAAVAGLTKTSVTCAVPSGSVAVCPASLSVTALQAGVSIPTLPAGSSLNFSVQATVTATSGSVTNTATIAISPSNSFITDPNLANNSATDTDFINPQLTLSKTVVGRALSTDDFIVQITNGASLVASGGTFGTNSATTGTQAVTAGTSYTLSEIGAGTPSTNLTGYSTAIACSNAYVASTTVLPSGNGQSFPLTPQAGDNIACTLSNSPLPQQLTVAKSASPNPFVAAQPAQYTITVSNSGWTITSTNITLTDTLPIGITLTSASGTNWSCSGTTSLSCMFSGTLAPTTSTTLVLTVAVGGSATTATNSATASGGGDATCPVAARCTGSTAIIVVTPVVNVSITKSDGNATYTPGAAVTYTITVTNTGPSGVNGAGMSDVLPKGVTTTGPWTCTPLSGGASCSTASGGTGGTIGDGITNILSSLTLNLPAPVSPATSSSATISIPVVYSANPADY
jgi:uncharacterized repeat protein (TIGR01451 family)